VAKLSPTALVTSFGLALSCMSHAQNNSQLLLRASTYNGEQLDQSFYNKLDLAFSTDGTNWRRISTFPVMPAYSRDASLTRHGNEFVAVYTDAFTSTNGTFGLARSTDLVTWTATNIKLKGPLLSNTTPNNTWAPEWFVDGTNYYVALRLSTTQSNTYGAPGIGYVECLDPGTWTNWTDFTAIPGVSPTIENDPFIIKAGTTYHLFTDHWDYGRSGNHAILHRQSTNHPFDGYGAPTNIAVNFTSAPAFVASGVSNYTAWEGQFVLPLGGDNFRLYFQAALQDASFCIESTNGMQSWDLSTMRRLLYDGRRAYGHGSVIAINPSAGLPVAAVAAYVSRVEEIPAQTVSFVQGNPQVYGLYDLSAYQANRLAGRSDVTSNPTSYGLYTDASIMDLNLGGIILEKSGSNAVLNLQLQTATNIAQGFTNHLTNVVVPVNLPGDRHFLRVRALGPQ